MNDDEVKLNTTKSAKFDGVPVLHFLPPTEEPSSLALAIAVTLVGWLIVSICGNASQMVLQIYTRRLDGRILPQYFIAVLLFINFLVPLGLPSMILEKLVRMDVRPISCNAHHILVAVERVIMPWGITALHASVAMFLTRPEGVTRIQRLLTSLAFVGLILLALTVAVPQGMAAELKSIHKDEIDGEQYIMIIYIYRCVLSHDAHPVTQMMRFGFEFVAPLAISVYLHLRIRNSETLTRNLVCVLVIHYFCNILQYIPETKWNTVLDMLPEEVNLQQLLPFLSPTLIWLPLGELSAAISRCASDKIEESRRRSRFLGRLTTEFHRSHLISNNMKC